MQLNLVLPLPISINKYLNSLYYISTILASLFKELKINKLNLLQMLLFSIKNEQIDKKTRRIFHRRVNFKGDGG